MKMLGSISQSNQNEILRLFSSHATFRRNDFRIHHHPVAELCFCLSGSGIYKTKENTYKIEKNDFFLFRPNEHHCITDITSEDGIVLINLHISPYFLARTLGDSPLFYAFFLSTELKSNKMNDFCESEKFFDIISRVTSEFENKNEGYETIIKNEISNLLIELGRALTQNTAIVLKQSHNFISIKEIIAEIDAHYTENITLTELADAINYNKNYLCSLFKQVFGTSLWEYISIKRIEKALELIKTTDLNITDIYLQCGYNNSANFNKYFKKYTGKTPHDFRKKH